MSEVRTFAEGALWWVQASAMSGGWLTASAPNSGLIGYVQAGTQGTSAQTTETIMNRGQVDHHKFVSFDPPEATFTYLEAVTANNPALIMTTAAGATMPLIHLELKENTKEIGTSSARYRRWHHCTITTDGWTEQAEGNQIAQTFKALSTVGPTASGYLA